MAQRLFATAKVPVFCDTYAPGVEKRCGEEVSIVTLTLRVQPFDAQLASSLDQGVGSDSNIKATVFSLNTGDPKPHFTRHDFKLGLARQTLHLFASTDTEVTRLALDQAKISGTYVRTQKDVDGLALVFKVSVGPVSREELEYIHAWVRGQRAVTFEESEGSIDFEEGPEDREFSEEAAPARPAPMFATDVAGRPLETTEEPAAPPPTRTPPKRPAKGKRATAH